MSKNHKDGKTQGPSQDTNRSKADVVMLSLSFANKQKRRFQRFFGLEERIGLKERVDKGFPHYVKAAFSDFDYTEHMWFGVLAVDTCRSTLTGVLSSHPADLKTIRYGDIVDIDLDDIEGLIIGGFALDERCLEALIAKFNSKHTDRRLKVAKKTVKHPAA